MNSQAVLKGEIITKIFLSRSTANSINLDKKHPWVKGIQVCSNKGPFFPRGENKEIAKIHWWYLKKPLQNPWANFFALLTFVNFADYINCFFFHYIISNLFYAPEMEDQGHILLSCLSFYHFVLLFETLTLLIFDISYEYFMW